MAEIPFKNTEQNCGKSMKYHVLMDTGETYYYPDGAFAVLSDREQKFPDPN